MLTVLLYLLRSLSEDLLGDFGKALKNIDPESCDSLSLNKSSLIKHLYLKSDVKTISTTPSARAYELVVTSFDQNKDFSIKVTSKKLCTSNCQTRTDDRKQNLSVFQTQEIKKDKVIKSINELINSYYHPSGKCGVCKNPKKFEITCENPPMIIAIDPTKNLLPVAEKINFLQYHYTLFAVAYNKDNHFVALIKFNCKILKYDGLTNDGRLSYYNKNKFSCYLENLKEKAVMYWYRRLII